eukprot:586522-Alexandrium_andersonii.AAC.1
MSCTSKTSPSSTRRHPAGKSSSGKGSSKATPPIVTFGRSAARSLERVPGWETARCRIAACTWAL